MFKISERYCSEGTEFVTICTECNTVRKKIVQFGKLNNTSLTCGVCGRDVPKLIDLKDKNSFAKIYSHWITGIGFD